MGITTTLGALVATVDRALALVPSPDEPNSVSTLVERGLSTRS